MTIRNAPLRCTGVESGGCTVNEYWSDPLQHIPTKIRDGVWLYRDYTVHYSPPPVPSRDYDYCWSHDDFDGAPDSGDARCGYGKSERDCYDSIDELELETKGETDED